MAAGEYYPCLKQPDPSLAFSPVEKRRRKALHCILRFERCLNTCTVPDRQAIYAVFRDLSLGTYCMYLPYLYLMHSAWQHVASARPLCASNISLRHLILFVLCSMA